MVIIAPFGDPVYLFVNAKRNFDHESIFEKLLQVIFDNVLPEMFFCYILSICKSTACMQ